MKFEWYGVIRFNVHVNSRLFCFHISRKDLFQNALFRLHIPTVILQNVYYERGMYVNNQYLVFCSGIMESPGRACVLVSHLCYLRVFIMDQCVPALPRILANTCSSSQEFEHAPCFFLFCYIVYSTAYR